MFSTVLTPLLNSARLVVRVVEFFAGCVSTGSSRNSPSHDTVVKRAAGATLALSVMVAQAVMFSLVLAFVWNMSMVHPESYPYARVVPGGALHYQTTFGFAALALVLGFTLFLLYVRAYEFYGHTLNRLPHMAVVGYGMLATVGGWALSGAFYAVTQSNYVRCVASIACHMRRCFDVCSFSLLDVTLR